MNFGLVYTVLRACGPMHMELDLMESVLIAADDVKPGHVKSSQLCDTTLPEYTDRTAYTHHRRVASSFCAMD